MREVFLLIKYNLTTPKIYFKQGQKVKFFCQIGLKYRKIVFKYWKHILNTLKSVSKYIWFGKGTDYETSWYIEYTLCFPISPNKVLTRGKRLLFISRLKTNACWSEYQQCFFFFFFLYIGAIFIYLPLSILTFYFVLLKKFAKIHFVSNFT